MLPAVFGVLAFATLALLVVRYFKQRKQLQQALNMTEEPTGRSPVVPETVKDPSKNRAKSEKQRVTKYKADEENTPTRDLGRTSKEAVKPASKKTHK